MILYCVEMIVMIVIVILGVLWGVFWILLCVLEYVGILGVWVVVVF